MATYVLVHGGDVSTEPWNRLTKGEPVHTANGRMGVRVWQTVDPYLLAKGHRVLTPTLIDEHNCNLHGHIEQVCHIIEGHNLRDVILVGHSYGGMVITGAAAIIPERIRRLVYLDAALPATGQSLFDIISSTGCDPVAAIPGLEPAQVYVDKIVFDPAKVKPLPKTFIRCTKSELANIVQISLDRIAADPANWIIKELDACHVCQPVAGEELAEILMEE